MSCESNQRAGEYASGLTNEDASPGIVEDTAAEGYFGNPLDIEDFESFKRATLTPRLFQNQRPGKLDLLQMRILELNYQLQVLDQVSKQSYRLLQLLHHKQYSVLLLVLFLLLA